MNQFDSNYMDKDNSIMGREIIGHLLQLHGVLKTFSISRLLSPEDLKKLRQTKDGKPSKSKKIFQENLKKYLEENKNESVPGTIYKKQIVTGDENIKDIVADIFSKQPPERKLPPVANPSAQQPKKSDSNECEACKKISKLAVFISNKLYEENLTENETAQVLLTAADMLNLDIDAFMRALDGNPDDEDDEDDEDEDDKKL